MSRYVWQTPEEIMMMVANQAKRLRKRQKISRMRLSELSNVSYGAIKRFEETGDISLNSLTKLTVALDATGEIKNIFANVPYKPIQEVMNENK